MDVHVRMLYKIYIYMIDRQAVRQTDRHTDMIDN